jgi:tRNA nucleotidyltransferase/poly(A) polymerase
MSLGALLAETSLAPVLAVLPRARLVGGCVRDALAGRPVADIDLATPDAPEAVLYALEGAGLRAIPTGLAHGTVTAISFGRPFEITTLRRDIETDGRHARVAWTDDFEQDAARRDFTINAMSLDQRGALHDYFRGEDDLRSGRVRFVGNATQRVAEDYLRILRFFRFYASYGRPPPDPDAAAAIVAGLAGLATLSAERVWSELKRILGAPDPREAVALMERLGVLQAILPEGTDRESFDRLIACGAPPDPLLRLAALLKGDEHALADRLKFSGAERDLVSGLRRFPAPDPGDDEAGLSRLLAEHPKDMLLGRLWLRHGEAPALRSRLEALAPPVFALVGRDALALGAAPGPHIGEALRRVRAWWVEDGCRATRAQLLVALADALTEAPG